jgi:hypothetical protein
MRKLGIIGLAIVAATAFGVWSADTVANAIMVSLGSSLPSEYWSHPY